MSLYVTPEKKKEGEENFQRAVGENLSRRQFLKGAAAGLGAIAIGGAAYFGYKKLNGNPVRAALIGGGDEGGVLMGYHNPDYLQIIAVCDIRPSNMKRIFDGEPAPSPRLGLKKVYGPGDAGKIKKYTDIKQVLDDKDVEAVVIALPLHLHAPVAIQCMKAGKHVLCEKLMAWNVSQCKEMIKTAEETDRVLTIGHQRHYSLLYHHALEVLKAGHLGEVRHIRALWHRNNTWPRLDKNGKEIKETIHGKELTVLRDGWRPEIKDEDRRALEATIRQHGYKSMEELVRWRLFKRTGGGLMAELGSHQLDACSIFLGKVKPLAVTGVGGKYFYEDEREVEDHVFTTFEFPGPNYWADKEHTRIKDKDDVVVVTYSSINTNSFEPYGECIMGTRGTMVVEMEKSCALYPERNPNKKASEAATTMTVAGGGGGKPAVDTTSTTGYSDPNAAQAVGKQALGDGPVSRGYREEMEDFAFCVRMHDGTKDPQERRLWRVGDSRTPGEPRGPRCHGRVAMADAIIALTSNLAMAQRRRIEFDPKWFLPDTPDVPDADMKPEVVTG